MLVLLTELGNRQGALEVVLSIAPPSWNPLPCVLDVWFPGSAELQGQKALSAVGRDYYRFLMYVDGSLPPPTFCWALVLPFRTRDLFFQVTQY